MSFRGGRRLVIRADASLEIGTGHVMRAVALAQAWRREGGDVTFVAAELPASIAARLQADVDEVVRIGVAPGSIDDATATIEIARAAGAEELVLDGYAYGPQYQQAVLRSGLKLLVVDDLVQQDEYVCDVLLNPNCGAESLRYPMKGPGRALLGPRYALIRTDIIEAVPEMLRAHPRVVVSFGGADAHNVSLTALRGIETSSWPKLSVEVIVGAANPHEAALRDAASTSRNEIEVIRTPPDVARRYASADVVITAGGSTCLELAFLGRPMIVIVTAANQERGAQALARTNAAVVLGDRADVSPILIANALTELLTDPKRREAMGQEGRRLVDGEGASRVVQLLTERPLRLRRARPADARQYWTWANDSQVRAVSFASDPIPWDTHVRWFKSKLGDRDALLLVAVDESDSPLGQIRFHRQGNEATVGVTIDPSRRGEGLGTDLIEQGTAWALRAGFADRVVALVKAQNVGSVKAFEKAGFTPSVSPDPGVLRYVAGGGEA